MPIFSCGVGDRRRRRARRGLGSGVSRPETARSSVDLPQPEPPITATISPSSDFERDAVKRTHAIGIGLADAFEGEHRQSSPARRSGLPSAGTASKRAPEAVGGLAEDREGDDRGDDLRGLAELLAVDQQKAKALRGAQEFGRDHEHPAKPQPGAQRDHVGRQHRRQQDAADHREAGQAEHAADLDDLAVDREHRAHDAEIDREEHADRDQDDLRGLEDAEPQDEQRHPGDRGDRAQRLQGRIDERGASATNSRRSAPTSVPAATPKTKPAATRNSVASDVTLQLAGAPQLGEGCEDHRRRRHQPAVRQPHAHRDFPEQRKPDRQQQPERRPQRAAPASCARAAHLHPVGGASTDATVMRAQDQTSTWRATRHMHGIKPHEARHPRAVTWPGTQARGQFVTVDVLVVDQIVDRFLDVDIGLDHAGLLQAPGRLRGSTRAAAGPILLWVSSVRSLSCLSTTASASLVTRDEDLLQLVVVGERIFARLLVGREHALHDVADDPSGIPRAH